MAEVSESDFAEVTKRLGPSDLQPLFLELGIEDRDIRHAEASVAANNTRLGKKLRASAVLRYWQQTKRNEATREAILQALKKCNLNKAEEELKELWSCKDINLKSPKVIPKKVENTVSKPEAAHASVASPGEEQASEIAVKTPVEEPDFPQHTNFGTWVFERRFGDNEGCSSLKGITECPNNGDVAVACWDPVPCVAVYDGENGNLKFKLDTLEECEPGRDSQPSEIVVNSNGTFFVTDVTQYVKVFFANGRYSKQFLTSPYIKLQDNQSVMLSGLTMDRRGHLLVGGATYLSGENCYISRHLQHGCHICSIAVEIMPRFLAVTPQDEIIISSDDSNTPVLIINAAGETIHTLNMPAEIYRWWPRGVCCGRGKIFISISKGRGQACVTCFSLTGDYLDSINFKGTMYPTGIALTGDGNKLMVVDNHSSSVNVYSLEIDY